METMNFPFTAIVGQEKIKLALILNAINPSIGGVLIKGEKGTGKTTIVRSLADLLPPIDVVDDCSFNCNPNDKEGLCDLCLEKDELESKKTKMKVVELPLGATEDMVVGSLDIEKALSEGIKSLDIGILGQANNNILYVDEINLLDDHLVDVLLDSAASGVNIIEREGISISHPSNFILIGTMNPDEGDLRGQLADRIGLHIIADSIKDVASRTEIMARREEFEEDHIAFKNKYQEYEEALRERILLARQILKEVTIKPDYLEVIARVCLSEGVDGHRSDIAILKTSKTLAAFQKRKEVKLEDIEDALVLVLGSRNPRFPYTKDRAEKRVEKANKEMENSKKANSNQENQEPSPQENNQRGNTEEENLNDLSDDVTPNEDIRPIPDASPVEESEEKQHLSKTDSSSNKTKGTIDDDNLDDIKTVQADDVGIDIKKLMKIPPKDKSNKQKGSRTVTKGSKGKYVKSKFTKTYKDIAIDASLRAAALRTFKTQNKKVKIKKVDIREKIRKEKTKAAITLLVDMSGSMLSERKANIIKGIIYQFIEDIEKNRDKLAVVGFKGTKSELIIPNTLNAKSYSKFVDEIKVGGTTPMAEGLERALKILKKEINKKELVPILIILSDGMPNVAIKENPIQDVLDLAKKIQENNINTIVVDFDKKSQYGRNINMEIALNSGGTYYDFNEIKDIPYLLSAVLDYERDSLII